MPRLDIGRKALSYSRLTFSELGLAFSTDHSFLESSLLIIFCFSFFDEAEMFREGIFCVPHQGGNLFCTLRTN